MKRKTLPKNKDKERETTVQKKRDLYFISSAQIDDLSEQHDHISLDYPARDLITVWLLGILPSTSLTVKLNLKRKIMVGSGDICYKIIKQINDQLKQNKVKKVEGIELSLNRQLYIGKLFGCRIFDKNTILTICDDMIEVFESKEVVPLKESIMKSKFLYLVVIHQLFDARFVSFIDSLKYMPEPNREEIKDAERKYQKLKRECIVMKAKVKYDDNSKKKSKVEQSRVQSSDSESQSSSDSLSSSEEEKKDTRSIYEQLGLSFRNKPSKIKDEEDIDGIPSQVLISKQQKRLIYKTWELHHSQFEVNDFLDWVRKNKILKVKDFGFQYSESIRQIICMSLFESNQNQEKMKSVSIYLENSRIVFITHPINSNIKAIETAYCKESKYKHVNCKIVHGFMKPGSNQYTIRGKILHKAINKSVVNSEAFVCVSIIGLKSLAEPLYFEISSLVKEQPTEEFHETIWVQYGNTKPFIADKRVKQFVQEQMKRTIQQFEYIQLKDMVPGDNNLELKLMVQRTQLDIYNKEVKDKLISHLNHADILFPLQFEGEDITKSLCEQFLIFPTYQRQHRVRTQQQKYILICSKDNVFSIMSKIIKEINVQNAHTQTKLYPTKNALIKIDDYIKKELKKKKPVTFHFGDKNQISISGPKKYVEKYRLICEDICRNMEEAQREQIMYLNPSQAKFIEKHKGEHQSQIQSQFAMTFQIQNNLKYNTLITLSHQQTIDLEANVVLKQLTPREFKKLPYGTNIFFKSQDDINAVKNNKGVQEMQKKVKSSNRNFIFTINHDGLFLLYTEGFDKKNWVHQFIEYCKKNAHIQSSFAFFLPKKQLSKNELVLTLIREFQNLAHNKKQKYKIFLFNSNLSEKITLKSKKHKDELIETHKVYFVEDGLQKYYFAESGNQKINEGIKQNKDHVYLYGKDINHTANSHICTWASKKIVHRISSKQHSFKQYADSIKFEIDGHEFEFEFPKSEYEKALKYKKNPDKQFTLSLGVYEIDLRARIQKNMFSGYERQVKEENIEVKIPLEYNMNISQDHVGGQLKVLYEKCKENSIPNVRKYFKKLIQGNKIERRVPIEEKLSERAIKNIKQSANEEDVDVDLTDLQELKLSCYDKGAIFRFQKLLPHLINPTIKFQKPKYWEKQKQDVEIFIVKKQSNEFKEIQDKITSAEIIELKRIQNKLIYKRYLQQKQNLKRLNQKDSIKELMLYHGTSKTDPKIIYEDKQECFNINYSSDSNFLGRGTYFAVQPEYSYRYSFHSRIGNLKFSEMLYCSVLVGDSQSIEDIDFKSMQMKDTQIKDQQKKIKYESSTTFTNGSIIYAVYRSKRAYPHYLIKYTKKV